MKNLDLWRQLWTWEMIYWNSPTPQNAKMMRFVERLIRESEAANDDSER